MSTTALGQWADFYTSVSASDNFGFRWTDGIAYRHGGMANPDLAVDDASTAISSAASDASKASM